MIFMIITMIIYITFNCCTENNFFIFVITITIIMVIAIILVITIWTVLSICIYDTKITIISYCYQNDNNYNLTINKYMFI